MPSPFLNGVRADMRMRGYSYQTEKTYVHWIKRYIWFIKKQHPASAGKDEVKGYLTYLATDRHVAINTQKAVLNALINNAAVAPVECHHPARYPSLPAAISAC